MIVYLIEQTDYDEYIDTTVGVFTNKQKAEEICKELNKDYYIKNERFYRVEEMLVDTISRR